MLFDALQALAHLGGIGSRRLVVAILQAGAQRVLLDNFPLERLHTAVERYKGRIGLEASGGIELETIRNVAETGVDFISTGDITKNVRAVDFSMRFL